MSYNAIKYGCEIDESKLYLLCNGENIVIDLLDVDRFEVLPKNYDTKNIKTKWTETAYIQSKGDRYYLFYLKNLSFLKYIFETNKQYLKDDVNKNLGNIYE